MPLPFAYENSYVAYEKSEKLAKRALNRVELYTTIKIALEQGDVGSAARIACSNPDECLLPKGYFFGNICAACKFHYNPYADLFYPELDPDSEDYGMPLEGESLRLLVERLMHDAYTPDTDYTYYSNILLDKGYAIS